jgi:hypothetical protein
VRHRKAGGKPRPYCFGKENKSHGKSESRQDHPGRRDKIGGRGTRQALEAVVNYTPGKPGGFSVHRRCLP